MIRSETNPGIANPSLALSRTGRNASARLAESRDEEKRSPDDQPTNRSLSPVRPNESSNPPAEPVYDPRVEQQSRAKKLREIAETVDRAIKRVGRFFKPEDLENPPGPLEIQRRVVAEGATSDRVEPEKKSESSPDRRNELARESTEKKLDVVV